MTNNEKYLLVNLEDEHSKKVAESIANKTARKILDYLSSKEEAGAEEISKELQFPLSTIDYNLKNLKKAGLIETKHFIWSNRGKKIILYKVAKKFIIIAPKGVSWKDEIKKIIPVITGAAIIGALIEFFTRPEPVLTLQKSIAEESAQGRLYASAPSMAPAVTQNPHYGFWFFIAVLAIILIYLLAKHIKKRK